MLFNDLDKEVASIFKIRAFCVGKNDRRMRIKYGFVAGNVVY